MSFNLFDFDVAPFGLMSSILILALTPKRYPVVLICLWIPMFVAVPLLVNTVGDWSYFSRQIVVYSTVPLVSMATYKAILAGVDIIKLTKFSILISTLCGIFQMLFSVNFFDFFVKTRTTDSRGVSSFFVEPSFFGLASIMFLLIYISAAADRVDEFDYYPFIGVMISVLFLSQSALCVLILLIIAVIFFINKLTIGKILKYLFILCLILIFASQLFPYNEESRLINVLRLIMENPSDILNLDASISERFFHVYLSIKLSIVDFLIPHGFYEFSEGMLKEQAVNPAFWWGEPSNKIMSGVGAVLFEIGFPSLILILTPIYLAFQFKNEKRKLFLIVAFGSIFVYSNALTFAVPYYSILIAVILSRLKNYGAGLPETIPPPD